MLAQQHLFLRHGGKINFFAHTSMVVEIRCWVKVIYESLGWIGLAPFFYRMLSPLQTIKKWRERTFSLLKDDSEDIVHCISQYIYVSILSGCIFISIFCIFLCLYHLLARRQTRHGWNIPSTGICASKFKELVIVLFYATV